MVGAAELTLDGAVGKLWGSAVLPAWRARGLCRQLVQRRATAAHRHGVRHCLVKARVGTPSPILRQGGFAQLATEVCYRRELA